MIARPEVAPGFGSEHKARNILPSLKSVKEAAGTGQHIPEKHCSGSEAPSRDFALVTQVIRTYERYLLE